MKKSLFGSPSVSEVTEVGVPPASQLLHSLTGEINYQDAYQVALRDPSMRVEAAYLAVFDYPPAWVLTLMNLRGLVAGLLGLKHAAYKNAKNRAQISAEDFAINRLAGPFYVKSIAKDELIVGDDDTHLDFRISVYKNTDATVTVSTIVTTHNAVGRMYMWVVKPFHRVIAKSMVQRAVNAGRL